MGSEELSFDENDRFYINTMYVSNRNKSMIVNKNIKHKRNNTIAQPQLVTLSTVKKNPKHRR